MVARMGKVASSPAIAIVGAGAVLANPGAFIPLALKSISETDPSAAGYVVEWLFFTLVSLLPLAIALVLLVVARDWAERLLERARDWLIARARTVASVILFLLAVVAPAKRHRRAPVRASSRRSSRMGDSARPWPRVRSPLPAFIGGHDEEGVR